MTQKNTTAGQVLAALGRAVCYLLLFELAQTLVAMAYGVVIMLYFTFYPAAVDPMELLTACTGQISLISAGVTLVVLTAFFLLRRKNPLTECGFSGGCGRWVLLGGSAAPVLYTVVTLVLGLLPAAWLEEYSQASASLSGNDLFTVAATVIAAPIVEEVIFRGLILSRLRRAMPGWLAVLLSALIFGLCHGQAVWMAYAFVIGLVFGLLALRARSIWPSLCAHMVFNATGQLLSLLEEGGLDPWPVLIALTAAGAVLCVIVLIGMSSRRRDET